MRPTTIGILAASALGLVGCGSGGTFANKPRPATPINLTVYVNNARVSVSPASVGAGPVVFIVTNQATQAVSLTILPAGASAAQPLADTGPINPQGTAKVTVNFDGPGEYTVTTGSQGSTDASQANTPPIRPASLHIGARRPNGSNALLQP